MRVRSAELSDLESIVRIHCSAFPQSYMTSLGPAFLKFFYSGTIAYPEAITLVAEDDSKAMCGFVAGMADPAEFYSWLNRNKLVTLKAMLPALMCRPLRIFGILSRYVRSSAVESAFGDRVELASIGVDSSLQGKGFGRLLVQAFCERALSFADKNEIYLTTDSDNNEQGNRFYQGLGFSCIGKSFMNDRLMNEYIRPIVRPGNRNA